MSGFDDNPFADPAVQSASSGAAAAGRPSGAAAGDALDDYNPFEKQRTTPGSGAAAAPQGTSAAPAVMNASMDAPPPYTKSGQQQITTADFQRRQEELERRAQELERREAELRSTPYNARANNWPPLPSFCPLSPCFYQDINVDIPVEFQKTVRNLYYLWLAHVGLLFANMIIGLLYLFAGGDWGGTFALALIYFVVFTPASFLCWFRPGYKAFRDDSSFNFMVFFFVFFFQFLISLMNTLGIMQTGSCGLVVGIQVVSNKTNSGFLIFVGVLMLIDAIGFALVTLTDVILLIRIHKMYRGTGGSLAKAQAEFTTGVMKNETVQRAAADAAQAQVRNTFGGGGGAAQPQQQQQQGGVRY